MRGAMALIRKSAFLQMLRHFFTGLILHLAQLGEIHFVQLTPGVPLVNLGDGLHFVVTPAVIAGGAIIQFPGVASVGGLGHHFGGIM